MPADGHLALRLVRLKNLDEWTHNDDTLCVVFPKTGAGKCDTRTIAHNLAPGDVLVLNGAAGGRILAADNADFIFQCFTLSLNQLFPLFGTHEICHLHSAADSFREVRFYPSATPLARDCHRLLSDVPPRFDLVHRILLIRVFAAILDLEFKTARPQPDGQSGADAHVLQVLEQLSCEEVLNASVGELADKFGCSRRHLNRLFHQFLGVSVAALRMEMRLLKAVSLLRDPNAKVINVAVECGFNHLGLFNTCFKRRFGTTPGRWRKKNASPLSHGSPVPDVAGLNDSCSMRFRGLCPWMGDPDALGFETEPRRNLPASAKAKADAKVKPKPKHSPTPKAVIQARQDRENPRPESTL